MRARWIVAAMAFGFVTLALALEYAPPSEASVVGCLGRSEPFHLVAHAILYGSLSFALAAWWFPPAALDESKSSLRRRALFAAGCFALIAGAQELCQALSRSRLPAWEELFDLTVDVGGATLGLIAWSRFDRRRRYPVARTLGVLLHPGLVGPLGVFALTWSTLRDLRAAAAWTLVSTLAVLPVAGVWMLGLRRGWYADRDLSVRSERPGFLAVALIAALALAGVVRAVGAPAVMLDLTLAAVIATVLVTAATVAGLKVSGHAAVPVGVVAMLQASSFRGPWPFLLVAVAVSWARVREGRHTPSEVLAGWSVAGASGLFARWVT